MSSSARGTVEAPGRRVRQKAGLNRAVLDATPGELRRQLSYKTSWYGSRLAVLDRWHPSSKTCSACGTVKSELSLSEREYHCTTCGLTIDRDLNAALIIARHAVPLVEGDANELVRDSGWGSRGLVEVCGSRAGGAVGDEAGDGAVGVGQGLSAVCP
ncbi:zinc ribbon domain-containing protein, partial [Streptomyces sp. BE20]|nr:zinc ribbon domain-containing protein [Streptomyces sp. BE20]